jgi:hypothetical protein
MVSNIWGWPKKNVGKLWPIARSWFSREVVPLRSLYRCGGREKIQDVSEAPKARMIGMSDAITTLIAQTFSLPVSVYLETKMCAVFMGQSFFKGRYNEFLEYQRGCSWYMMWDWSGFDSLVNDRVLRAALTIFRNFFKEEAWDRFDAVANDFLNRVMTYEGWLLGMRSGLPSGHAWTSLVGTLANWVMTFSLISALWGIECARRARISVCGDDVFVGMYDNVPMADERVLQGCAEVLFSGKLRQYAVSLTLDGPDAEGMSFLAHGFRDGKPVRWPAEIVDSLLYPQSFPRTRWDRLTVALAFVMDTPWNEETLVWLKPWVRECYIECRLDEEEFENWWLTCRLDAMSLSDDADTDVSMAIVPENLRIFAVRRVRAEGYEVETGVVLPSIYLDTT